MAVPSTPAVQRLTYTTPVLDEQQVGSLKDRLFCTLGYPANAVISMWGISGVGLPVLISTHDLGNIYVYNIGENDSGMCGLFAYDYDASTYCIIVLTGSLTVNRQDISYSGDTPIDLFVSADSLEVVLHTYHFDTLVTTIYGYAVDGSGSWSFNIDTSTSFPGTTPLISGQVCGVPAAGRVIWKNTNARFITEDVAFTWGAGAFGFGEMSGTYPSYHPITEAGAVFYDHANGYSDPTGAEVVTSLIYDVYGSSILGSANLNIQTAVDPYTVASATFSYGSDQQGLGFSFVQNISPTPDANGNYYDSVDLNNHVRVTYDTRDAGADTFTLFDSSGSALSTLVYPDAWVPYDRYVMCGDSLLCATCTTGDFDGTWLSSISWQLISWTGDTLAWVGAINTISTPECAIEDVANQVAVALGSWEGQAALLAHHWIAGCSG